MDYDIKTNQELKEDDRKDAINGKKKEFSERAKPLIDGLQERMEAVTLLHSNNYN